MMLKSLVIKNFRMLEDFTVEKLGRVNLIVGKNNSGKSTVLEALRIYAGNANLGVLQAIAMSHDEKYFLGNTLEIDTSFPFEDLFTNRNFPKKDGEAILIGQSESDKQSIYIEHVFFCYESSEGFVPTQPKVIEKSEILSKQVDIPLTPIRQGLWIHNYARDLSYINEFGVTYPNYINTPQFQIPTAFIPTQFIFIDELARDWDKIVFTKNEAVLNNALKIILPECEGVVFVQNEIQIQLANQLPSRSAKVKLSNLSRPVPLKSLGDGMLRILQIAIKLVSAQSGFLLIDEFENGLHYSVQEKVWTLLFEMAEKLDVQIFATTHSWDCIRSFNAVALEKENSDAVLFRMGKSKSSGKVIETIFDKEKLSRMTESDIEVR